MKLLVCTFVSVWRESTQSLTPEGEDKRSFLSPSFASWNFRTFGPLWSETISTLLDCSSHWLPLFCWLLIVSVVAKCTNWPSPWVCMHRNIVTRSLALAEDSGVLWCSWTEYPRIRETTVLALAFSCASRDSVPRVFFYMLPLCSENQTI